jgi:dihydrodipicolinate synthase/N-acetylneuraminate lyase
MATALETQLKVNRVIDVVIKHEVISSVKYMCGMMGFPVGNPNPPLRAYTPEEAAAIEREAKEAGWPFV